MEEKEKMLPYEYDGEGVSVPLKNGFKVSSLSKWNNDEKIYYSKFYIQRLDVSMPDFVEEDVPIHAEMKNLRVTIARYVTKRFYEGFYDFYMNRFNEQMEIFDIGTEIYDAKNKEVTANA